MGSTCSMISNITFGLINTCGSNGGGSSSIFSGISDFISMIFNIIMISIFISVIGGIGYGGLQVYKACKSDSNSGGVREIVVDNNNNRNNSNNSSVIGSALNAAKLLEIV